MHLFRLDHNPFTFVISKFLYYLYALEIWTIRKFVLKIVTRIEGGEAYSLTLRRIFSSYHGIKIGMYSYGSCFSPQHIPVGTEIGRYCSFAKNVHVFNGNHPVMNISMHPFFYNPVFKYVDKNMIRRTKLIIGNDVWIGFNAIILPSVSRIEDGAVIGAGSVVTKDVPHFAIVAGNPAKIIKYRFSEGKITEIIKLRWWEKDMSELESDIDSFLSPIE